MRRYGIHNLGVLSVPEQAARMPGIPYVEKVLSYNPIAYWIMGEAAGGTSIDQINSPAQDGAYTGVTLGQPGIGDGNTCPFFDGANDYNDIQTVAFNAAFNGQEGTICIWQKVTNAGVWIDGTLRMAIHLRVDASNFININKNNGNNAIQFVYRANATNDIVTHSLGASPTTDWFFTAITFSLSAGGSGEVKAYYGLPGEVVQVGATQVGLGAWAGNLSGTLTNIGSLGQPSSVYNGYLAHVPVFNSALPLATIQDIGRL